MQAVSSPLVVKGLGIQLRTLTNLSNMLILVTILLPLIVALQ